MNISKDDTVHYFTDGSVDPEAESTGAAVWSTVFSGMWRTSNSCSTTQTELVAISKALEHATLQHYSSIAIHTDSRAALQAIQKTKPQDNIFLITTCQAYLQRLRQLNTDVVIHWIPSHVGVQGNDNADLAAKTATKLFNVQLTVHPSRSQLIKKSKQVLSQLKLKAHHEWVARDSPSALWYKAATEYQSHTISKFTKRHLATIVHRLRLGYKCSWEVIAPEERECIHCEELTPAPLLHYLLECIVSAPLRQMTGTPDAPPDDPLAFSIGTAMVSKVLQNLAVTQDFLLSFPPPR